MLKNGERPFEVCFEGSVNQLHGKDVFRDVNQYVDLRLSVGRWVRNKKVYLVVYRHRTNGQFSLNAKGLVKAYTEAWVGLRTFRTELSHGTVDSLGVHFQKYYGSSLLGVLLQGNDWLDRSTAERAQQAAAKEIEKKRQLDAIENLAFDRCGKSKNAAGRRKAYLSDLLEFLHTNLGIKREDFQFNKMEATEAIHSVMFKYEGDDDPVFTKELADSWLWSQLDVKKPKGLNDSMHAS